MSIGAVNNNQVVNAVQDKSLSDASSNTKREGLATAEQGQLEDAIVGVISMQALSSGDESRW